MLDQYIDVKNPNLQDEYLGEDILTPGCLTQEDPTLQALWQYALRFRIEELFLDSKSGAFQLEESKIRVAKPCPKGLSQSIGAFIFGGRFGCFICDYLWHDSSIKGT